MNNETKTMSDNRKALPKFLLFLFISLVVGFLVGLASGFLSSVFVPEQLIQQCHEFITQIAPAAIWIVVIVFDGIGLSQYMKAKKIYENWNEEDEEWIEQAEMKINWSILFSNIAMVLGFFLFGCIMILIEDFSYIGLAGFIASCAAAIILQQKDVDLIRKLNPEKQGSVYDVHFHKKWVESCDENEIRQLGQAAYKSWRVTNYTCIGLYLVTLVISTIFETGIFALVILSIIWLVLLTSFCFATFQTSK